MSKLSKIGVDLQGYKREIILYKYSAYSRTDAATFKMYADRWALGGCGTGTIHSFGYMTNLDFSEKAMLASVFYKCLCEPGNVIYSISSNQVNNAIHNMLLELGAFEISRYPNAYHAPSDILVFQVNIRNAVGRFCDSLGNPFYEEPKTVPEIQKFATPNKDGSYWYYPGERQIPECYGFDPEIHPYADGLVHKPKEQA